jgi:hypothetical protein
VVGPHAEADAAASQPEGRLWVRGVDRAINTADVVLMTEQRARPLSADGGKYSWNQIERPMVLMILPPNRQLRYVDPMPKCDGVYERNQRLCLFWGAPAVPTSYAFSFGKATESLGPNTKRWRRIATASCSATSASAGRASSENLIPRLDREVTRSGRCRSGRAAASSRYAATASSVTAWQPTVIGWRDRYEADGIRALEGEPQSRRPRSWTAYGAYRAVLPKAWKWPPSALSGVWTRSWGPRWVSLDATPTGAPTVSLARFLSLADARVARSRVPAAASTQAISRSVPAFIGIG